MTKNSSSSRIHQAAIVSLLVSVLVFLIKFSAFFVSRSEAVFSDALESTVNIVASIVALWSIRQALKPADEDHPYGHGKFESVSSAFEGGLISFAGVIIILKSIYAWIEGVELEKIGLGLGILTVAGLINGVLAFYLIYIGKKHKSHALVASGQHVFSDFFTSLGAFIALILVYFTSWSFLDPLIAIFLGTQLLWMGVRVLKGAMSVLTDEYDESLIRTLGELFTKNAFTGIIRIHHTRIIRSGRFHHIDAHVVVPEFWSVEEAHKKTDLFEEKIIKEYPGDAEMHIHTDPCFRSYCKMCDLSSCPVRGEPFEKKIPFSYEEIVAPDQR